MVTSLGSIRPDYHDHLGGWGSDPDRLVNLYRGRGVPPVYLDLDLDLADIRFYIHGTHPVLLEILHHRPLHPHL